MEPLSHIPDSAVAFHESDRTVLQNLRMGEVSVLIEDAGELLNPLRSFQALEALPRIPHPALLALPEHPLELLGIARLDVGQ